MSSRFDGRGVVVTGAGWISQVRWERSEGTYFDPAGLSPDDVQDAWAKINDFANATHPTSTGSTMRAIGANPHLRKD